MKKILVCELIVIAALILAAVKYEMPELLDISFLVIVVYGLTAHHYEQKHP